MDAKIHHGCENPYIFFTSTMDFHIHEGGGGGGGGDGAGSGGGGGGWMLDGWWMDGMVLFLGEKAVDFFLGFFFSVW